MHAALRPRAQIIAATISAFSLAEERRWHDRYAIGAAVGLGAGGDNDGVQ
jgi:hypothetical protein